ncbi:MAG: hypothetical protein HLUCCO17_16070 [Saliniramus fredricksonii]|uniref:Uncharacterized protein n=2 Tax=Saliniramus fredricksonii TaxID=1653334 RepID=A0A0P7XXD2_9HYPH|nr:hypothetical protein [Saliniramus fredricksonii]KPQ09126.1 MAG: hypothetical protein HLUCCO17_16070 [Saliniramus fredricksonii]
MLADMVSVDLGRRMIRSAIWQPDTEDEPLLVNQTRPMMAHPLRNMMHRNMVATMRNGLLGAFKSPNIIAEGLAAHRIALDAPARVVSVSVPVGVPIDEMICEAHLFLG